MPLPNESTDATPDPNGPTPDDSTTDNQTAEQDERHTADQPFCRVFGGPTSHRVQFAGPESQPATAIDRAHNERPSADDTHHDDIHRDGTHRDGTHRDGTRRDGTRRDELQTAEGRAITAILERRLAALERALVPLREACLRGESPDVADVRVVRIRLAEFQIAIEEYAAQVCPDATLWESAGEQIPRARLAELLEGDECVQRLENSQGDCGESG